MNAPSPRALLLAAAALALAAAPAHAQLNVPAAPPCTLGGQGFDIFAVTYWAAGPNFDHRDERCDNPGECKLHAWVVMPHGVHNHKAIVMAHGSSGLSDYDQHSLNEYCEVTKRLANDGFVVYWPFRRGTFDITTPAMIGHTLASPGSGYTTGGRFGGGASPGDPNFDRGGYFTNTGWAAADWAAQMSGGAGGGATHDYYYLYYINDEAAQDMNDAINALVNLNDSAGNRLVDPARIAFAGHSIGGAVATLASAVKYDHEPKVFASLSGGAMSYGSSNWWPQWMINAAKLHQAPIYFHRALLEDPASPPSFASSTQPYEAAVAVNTNGGQVLYNYPKPDVQQSLCTGQLADPSLHYWCVHAQFVTNPYFIDGFWFPRFLEYVNSKL